MARMLGLSDALGFGPGNCDGRPGPGGRRLGIRRERRGLLQDWRAELDADYRRSLMKPYDRVDCRHGCNGDCVRYGGERCDFTCHEG